MYFQTVGAASSLPDDNTTDHLDRQGPNQTIRISDLVGHGRYVQPSTSVRVSDLLNGIPQITPIRRLNESVTISELLRGPKPNYQISCK